MVLHLKIDYSVCSASILMTFPCHGERLHCLSRCRLTHTEHSWYVRLWSFPMCLCFLLFPQRTSAYVDPHPPWKSRTNIPEMICQIVGILSDKVKKKKVERWSQNLDTLVNLMKSLVHFWLPLSYLMDGILKIKKKSRKYIDALTQLSNSRPGNQKWPAKSFFMARLKCIW